MAEKHLVALCLFSAALTLCPTTAPAAVVPGGYPDLEAGIEEQAVEFFVSRGERLRAAGDPAGALSAFRGALAIEPEHPRARYGLGLAHLDRQEFEEAIAAARELRKNPAELDRALDLLNRISDEFARERERVRRITEIVRTQSREVREIIGRVRPRLIFQRAGELMREEKYAEALPLFEEAVTSAVSPTDREEFELGYLRAAREIFRAGYARRAMSEEQARLMVERVHRFLDAAGGTPEPGAPAPEVPAAEP